MVVVFFVYLQNAVAAAAATPFPGAQYAGGYEAFPYATTAGKTIFELRIFCYNFY
jgi:hypothetical protein